MKSFNKNVKRIFTVESYAPNPCLIKGEEKQQNLINPYCNKLSVFPNFARILYANMHMPRQQNSFLVSIQGIQFPSKSKVE